MQRERERVNIIIIERDGEEKMESLCLTPGFDLSGFSFLLMGNHVFRVFAAEITKVKRNYSELVSISPASSVLKSVFAN